MAEPRSPSPGFLPDSNTRRAARPFFGWFASAGGATLAVGAVLEAVSGSPIARAAFNGTSYLDGDGPIQLVLGIAIVVLGTVISLGIVPPWAGWIVVALGVLAGVIAVVDIVDIRDSLDQIEVAFGASGSVGPAPWVCLVGAVISVSGGVLTAVASTSDA